MLLEVKNLSKEYGKKDNKVIAVNNVSFNVEKGEFVIILGSSGSGKSTLLHMVAGVDKPTDGVINVNGRDINKLNDDKLSKYRRTEVGLVYQFYNLIPILDVKDNITLPVLLDNKKVDKNYFDSLVDILGLKSRLKHLPNELSGGEQQRVSIARSLIIKPSLLLADEPTGNLDSKASIDTMNLLKFANEKLGQTIIMVTHDDALAHYASRIIRLKDGQIIDDYKVEA